MDTEVVEYQQTPPTAKELKEICAALKMHPLEITRTREDLFKELKLSTEDERSDAEWYKILQANPKLIERPIVLYKGKAALGRPPENILKILPL